MNSVLRRVGKRLKDLREEASLTQEQVAHAAGLSTKYISQLENGHSNPSLIVLERIAERAFHIPLAALFAFEASGSELRDEGKAIATLLGPQPRRTRRKALQLIRALLAPVTE